MPLYRLPAVLEAVRAGVAVHVTEGEHDADVLHELGLVATTSPHGAVAGNGGTSAHAEPGTARRSQPSGA